MNSLRDAQVTGKKVIVWTDLDVPLADGKVVEKVRLLGSAKTINFLLGQKAKVLLIGHLGRPVGRDANFSLKPVVETLARIVGRPIEFLENITTPTTDFACLENIRFWPEEEKGDAGLAKEIGQLGEIYINDCFASSHHAGSTMLYLPEVLPSFLGLALEREVHELTQILEKPKRPLIAILAGAKLETKLPAIKNMCKIADQVLVGGKLMFEFKENIPNVLLANDNVDGADIGPGSISAFKEQIRSAATIVWNGTLGKYEDEKYIAGTKEIAYAVINSGAYSVVGGGDTAAALDRLGLLAKINYVSMGGGAMLEFLAGERLAGLAAVGYYSKEKS